MAGLLCIPPAIRPDYVHKIHFARSLQGRPAPFSYGGRRGGKISPNIIGARMRSRAERVPLPASQHNGVGFEWQFTGKQRLKSLNSNRKQSAHGKFCCDQAQTVARQSRNMGQYCHRKNRHVRYMETIGESGYQFKLRTPFSNCVSSGSWLIHGLASSVTDAAFSSMISVGRK